MNVQMEEHGMGSWNNRVINHVKAKQYKQVDYIQTKGSLLDFILIDKHFCDVIGWNKWNQEQVLLSEKNDPSN